MHCNVLHPLATSSGMVTRTYIRDDLHAYAFIAWFYYACSYTVKLGISPGKAVNLAPPLILRITRQLFPLSIILA